jgi:hypothetical protein
MQVAGHMEDGHMCSARLHKCGEVREQLLLDPLSYLVPPALRLEEPENVRSEVVLVPCDLCHRMVLFIYFSNVLGKISTFVVTKLTRSISVIHLRVLCLASFVNVFV